MSCVAIQYKMQPILNHLPNSEKQIFIECALIHICILLPYRVTAFKLSTMHAYRRLPLYKHNSIVSPYMAVNTFRTCQRLGKWQDILEASLQAYHFLMMNVIFLYNSSFHSIFSLRVGKHQSLYSVVSEIFTFIV